MEYTKAPIIKNPVMIDRVIGEIQTALVSNLDWLDAAFGRAQRLVKILPTGKRITTPNVYCGGLSGKGVNDYIEVSPDSQIGNFSFCLVDDPQNLEWEQGGQMTERVPFSIVFWFDLRTIFPYCNDRNTEYVKAQILQLLNGRTGWRLNDGRLRFNRIYEQAPNIYRGFSLDEIDNQFLMHPYAGLRFDGELSVDMPCELPTL